MIGYYDHFPSEFDVETRAQRVARHIIDQRSDGRKIPLRRLRQPEKLSKHKALMKRRLLAREYSGERYQWNRIVYVFGSMEPFEPEMIGFAMPLPNCANGYLTCAGTMPDIWASSPEKIAVEVISDFWQSHFYPELYRTELTDGTYLKDISQVKERNFEVYRLLPQVQGFRLEWDSKIHGGC